MKAAIVRAAGATPVFGAFDAPVAAPGEQRIRVSAAAISPVVRGRASGRHYSAAARFPFVVGIDGVGRLDDGRRVYFVLPAAPFGSLAELATVPAARVVPLPDDLDDVRAAALANPGLSSWAALTLKARLRPGETVLINGATGAAGGLAVRIARHLGAARVIATGRNAAALATCGADATIALDDDTAAMRAAFEAAFTGGVDVVVDYLWGATAEALIAAAARTGGGRALRFVQVGSASGEAIALPSAALRAAPVALMGSGIGSLTLDDAVVATAGVLQAAVGAGLTLATRTVALADIEREWTVEDGRRTVVMLPV